MTIILLHSETLVLNYLLQLQEFVFFISAITWFYGGVVDYKSTEKKTVVKGEIVGTIEDGISPLALINHL